MPSKTSLRDELSSQMIAGRYRIISQLGAGGMGTAYRAWDEQAGIPVVIKIPKKAFLEDPKFAERFYREIRLLQGLRHPHIVPIVDVGAHDGLPFVAMRFLPGGSLSNRRLRDDQRRTLPNPPGMLHLWLPAVAEALDYVHSEGVVHRDVKPANIFFDAFWNAFLGDFGIAKIVEESESFDRELTLTATNMGIGTQEYMGPEQFTPKPVLDGRTDQYALAVMAYEMLTGSRPFTGATAHLIVEVTTHPVPRLDRKRAGLPASLVEAIHRGLAKNPQERFSTCREFAATALQDVAMLADDPDTARLLCPKCSNILKLPVTAAGRKGKCPKCQTQMKVAEDLGALWLLDEARRQQRASATVIDIEGVDDGLEAGSSASGSEIDEGALETFNPVSSTTPIEKAARREARKVSPLAIWGGFAGVLLATVVIWNFLPGSKTKKTSLTYAQQVAKAEATLKSDPLNRPANEFLGRHWCFKEQNWDKGLRYFAKSNSVGFTSAAEKELKAREVVAASPGDLIRAAQEWWKVAGQPTLNTPESPAAIKKHAAAMYIAVVDSLTAPKDIEDTTRWLDRDADFRSLVGNKRPPHAKPATAQEILARPPITNSIGMKLKLIPSGTFTMGSEGGQADEKPVHVVRISKPFYIGVYEVTNVQWKSVMGGEPPSMWKEDDCPVERTTWNDAVEFCRKLSERPEERVAGRIYRLPTEAEWEYSCRAGTTTVWSSGDDKRQVGNYAWIVPNSGGRTHPVGGKQPNSWNIYDMHGNVYEWCSDWHGPYPDRVVTDPTGPDTGSGKVNRGGGWIGDAGYCRSAHRDGDNPLNRVNNQGFRVALGMAVADWTNQVQQPVGNPGAGAATASIPPAGSEERAQPAATAQEIIARLPITNSIGMKLKLIPTGAFMMGSEDGAADEKPIHEVHITRPFHIGVTEVTNAQWKTVMGSVSSRWKEDDRPVEQVSWHDAVEFCRKLSGMPEEQKAGRSYRLPTEAEWEYACRAATKSRWPSGDDENQVGDFAWFSGNAGGQTHPVGTKKPNPWGLYDTHGNVHEWCSDRYAAYGTGRSSDPSGPPEGPFGLHRGGSWLDNSTVCRSANRGWVDPGARRDVVGFRVAMVFSATAQTVGGAAASDPGSVAQFRSAIGQTLLFNVVGSATSGPVWGSNPYTADSRLARAAVHAGVLRSGESGVVRVTILPGLEAYEGSVRNGVTTSRWGPYSLAFRIEGVGDASQVRAAPDPGNLLQHRNLVGQTLLFSVVGSATSGPVWGSNPYTADSRLSRAAVHAGVLQLGEAGLVSVTVLPGLQSYEASARNGVASARWGPYPLSYRIEKVKKQLAAPEVPDPVVGRWRWFVNGSEVPGHKFLPNGIVEDVADASWLLVDPKERRYQFAWGKSTFIDVMTLSVDGKTLRGRNNQGMTIIGNRIE